jgi:hypothetical protein
VRLAAGAGTAGLMVWSDRPLPQEFRDRLYRSGSKQLHAAFTLIAGRSDLVMYSSTK